MRRASASFLLSTGLVLLAVLAPSAESVGPAPGEYPYAEAVAAGLLDPADFQLQPGEQVCPPLPDPIPTTPEVIPDDAPSCYRPPEEQGIVALVLPPGDPGFGSAFNETGNPDYRFSGPYTINQFQGGSATFELRDPAVLHCEGITCQKQHFFSRVEGLTTAGNRMEVGWVEMNHPTNPPSRYCDNINDQFVFTVTQPPGGEQSPICWLRYNIVPGNEYSFRVRHFGEAGYSAVALQFFVDPYWERLLLWNGRRCWNSDGTRNCWFHFDHEAYDTARNFFHLGEYGADGLLVRNVKLRTSGPPNEVWQLFDWNDFLGEFAFPSHPYWLCPEIYYYRFATYFPLLPPSC